jgi:hypothetical protein
MHQDRLRSISAQAAPSLGIARRKPQRITITVSWSVYQTLIETSDHQGRSLSNAAAYWLERQAELFQHRSA